VPVKGAGFIFVDSRLGRCQKNKSGTFYGHLLRDEIGGRTAPAGEKSPAFAGLSYLLMLFFL
jgi:hypothetical protein